MTLESPGSVARAAAPAPTFSIIATCLVLLGVAVVPAYGQTAAAAKALAEGTAPAESSKAAEETPEAEEEFEWFTTDTPNLRYRVARVPKVEKAFKWIDENRVKMPGGAIFEVVDHDDEWFWVKYFEWIKKPERFKPPETGPSEEEKEQIRASYEIDLAKADRLRLREFDKGLPRAGQWRNGFDVADMNGDGHLDIVFSARRKGASHPNIFLGDGAGNWRAWREAAYPRDQPYDYGDAAVADFNGDGHQDIAFGFHLRGLLVLLGDGAGGFRAWTEGIALDFPGRGGDATAFSSRAIDVIDWNGDGRMDVIALGEGPKGTQTGTQRTQEEKGFGKLIDTSRGFLVYLNQGDGTWVPERPARDIQQADFGDDFAVADFNGDGHPELVTATRRLGNEHILSVGSEDGAMEARAILQLRPSALISSLDAVDLNDDGQKDLIVGYRNHELQVWRTGIDILISDGDLGWTRQPLMAQESRKGIAALDTGDVDGDGRLDIVATTGEGEVWLFLGNADGGWTYEESEELPAPIAGCQGFHVRVVDIDREGGDEIIVSFAGEPTGYPGIPDLSHAGCAKEGSVRAWTLSTGGDDQAAAQAP